MNFINGQITVTSKALGQRNGYERGSYFYGHKLKDIPLGTKCKIVEIEEGYVNVSPIGSRFRYFGHLDMHPDELALDPKNEILWSEARKKAQGTILSLLTKPIAHKCYDEGKNTGKFEPKFNVREEFAVWVRNEFPRYRKIGKRRKEVCDAAIEACKHGKKTSQTCVRDKFEYYLEDFRGLRKSNASLVASVSNLVKWIEEVSVNLRKGERFYGTELTERRRR